MVIAIFVAFVFSDPGSMPSQKRSSNMIYLGFVSLFGETISRILLLIFVVAMLLGPPFFYAIKDSRKKNK